MDVSENMWKHETSKRVFRSFQHNFGHLSLSLPGWLLIYKRVHRCFPQIPARETKQFFPAIDRKKASNVVQLNHEENSLVTQLITGHCFLNRLSALMDPSLNAECQLCYKEEGK
jgi:hypothetical protein